MLVARAQLLEREFEIAELTGALDAAAAGSGRAVVLSALAGMGKSALLAAVGTEAASRGFHVLRARGIEVERDVPLGLAGQLFDSLRQTLPPDRRADISELLTTRRPDGGDVAARVGPPGGALHRMYWFLADLSDARPVALLVDDVHWGDEASLAFLAFLVPRLDDVSVTLVMATRPEEADRDRAIAALTADRAATALTLRRLSPAAVVAMIEARLGRSPSEQFAAVCTELTGGNPFYIHELCGAIRTAGIEPADGNAAIVRTLTVDTVGRAVLRRVVEASPGALAMARSLAVLGERTELRLVAALAGLDQDAATSSVAALARADVFADERPLRFVHPIVRAAIAADPTAAEQAAAQGRAARLLSADGAPPEQIAGHLLLAEPLADGWVVDELQAAAQVALQRGAPAIATRYLRRALEEPAGDVAWSIMQELGAAEFRSGDTAALGHLEQALAAAPDARTRAATARELATVAATAGNVEQALAVLTASREELSDEDHDVALGVSADISGLALLGSSSTSAMMSQLLRYQDAPGATQAERQLLANLSIWLAATGAASAPRCGEIALRAVGGAESLSDVESPSFHEAAFVLIAADRFAQARASLDTALVTAQRQGSVVAFAAVSMMRSLLAYRVGDLSVAESEARASIGSMREQGWPALPIAGGFLVDALIERGALSEAQQVLDEFEVGLRAVLDMPLLAAQARLHLAAGESARGIEGLLELAKHAAGGVTVHSVGAPTIRTYVAPPLAALGRRDEAAVLIAEELEYAERWGAKRGIGMALHSSGLVLEGDQGRERLEQAVSTLRETDARLEYARALVDLGGAIRRSGGASAARDWLRQGLAIAHQCGADALETRATEELSATGARRVNRTMLSGIDALTASEKRIAAMAAEGRTNREIAQALFVSRKTVEMHLSRAFRKLGVAVRAELGAALATGRSPADA
jgi:DNA-binding CsgD family transcriptional regulator